MVATCYSPVGTEQRGPPQVEVGLLYYNPAELPEPPIICMGQVG